MDQLKEWVVKHRALAIGGGIAFAVLIYLWLRSGSTQQAADPNAGVNAYYAAQAAGAGAAADTSMSTDALAASTNQTNTQGSVALAQIQAALDAVTSQSNLTAYQDYLSEQALAGTGTTSGPVPTTFGSNTASGTPIVFAYKSTNGDDLINTDAFHIYDVNTGQTFTPGQNPAQWNSAVQSSRTAVTWAGPGSAPVPYVTTTTVPTPPLTFQQFVGQSA